MFYTNKYQEHAVCNYGYKLVCLNMFIKTLLSHTWVKMLYTILLLAWSKKILKWWDEKKYFNKELVMTTEDDEDFENSTKC